MISDLIMAVSSIEQALAFYEEGNDMMAFGLLEGTMNRLIKSNERLPLALVAMLQKLVKRVAGILEVIEKENKGYYSQETVFAKEETGHGIGRIIHSDGFTSSVVLKEPYTYSRTHFENVLRAIEHLLKTNRALSKILLVIVEITEQPTKYYQQKYSTEQVENQKKYVAQLTDAVSQITNRNNTRVDFKIEFGHFHGRSIRSDNGAVLYFDMGLGIHDFDYLRPEKSCSMPYNDLTFAPIYQDGYYLMMNPASTRTNKAHVPPKQLTKVARAVTNLAVATGDAMIQSKRLIAAMAEYSDALVLWKQAWGKGYLIKGNTRAADRKCYLNVLAKLTKTYNEVVAKKPYVESYSAIGRWNGLTTLLSILLGAKVAQIVIYESFALETEDICKLSQLLSLMIRLSENVANIQLYHQQPPIGGPMKTLLCSLRDIAKKRRPAITVQDFVIGKQQTSSLIQIVNKDGSCATLRFNGGLVNRYSKPKNLAADIIFWAGKTDSELLDCVQHNVSVKISHPEQFFSLPTDSVTEQLEVLKQFKELEPKLLALEKRT